MSRRTITVKGGPAHGKRYTVAPTTESFPSPLASVPGTYRVTEKQAIWEPGSKPAPEAPADKAAPAPAPKPKRPAAAKPTARAAKAAAKAAASAAPGSE